MRELWIMRHGDADWSAGREHQRQLTDLGRAQVRSVAGKLLLQGEFTVCVSPLDRAQQTCDVLLSSSDIQITERTKEPLLKSETDPKMTAEWVNASGYQRLILVSHMPLVANLLVELTADSRIGAFHTAQVVQCIQPEQNGAWQVASIYSPSHS